MPVSEFNKRKRSFSECVDYKKFNLSVIPKKINKKKMKQMKKNLLESLNDLNNSNSLDFSMINKKIKKNNIPTLISTKNTAK